MKRIYLLALMSLLLPATSIAASKYPILPDAKLTPGATRKVETKEVCTQHTGDVRNVPESEKKQVFKEYGLSGNDDKWCSEDGCEIDHLISLELGGSNDITNLWPQSYNKNYQWNARVKDGLENHLHKLVCDGTITMEEAQSAISTDWVAAYKKYMKK